ATSRDPAQRASLKTTTCVDRKARAISGAAQRGRKMLVGLEAVAHRFDAHENAVLEPDSLHELVGTEIVDPHFHVDFRGGSRYDARYGPGHVVVDCFLLDLGGIATQTCDFRARGPLINDSLRAA